MKKNILEFIITFCLCFSFSVGGYVVGYEFGKQTKQNEEAEIKSTETQIKIVESGQIWEYVSDNPFNEYSYKIKLLEIKGDYVKFEVIGENHVDSFPITNLQDKCWSLICE